MIKDTEIMGRFDVAKPRAGIFQINGEKNRVHVQSDKMNDRNNIKLYVKL